MPKYQDLNISYSPDINDIFTCNLELISNDDSESTFTVTSTKESITSPEYLLSYDNIISTSVNKLGFDSNYTKTKSLTDTFTKHNFINNTGTYPIAVKYKFIAGFPVHIVDIGSTEVPATTVCALCHKNSDGVYNYEDFGIYENDGNFYSSAMFFNGGTAETETFGLARQLKISSTHNKFEVCQPYASVDTEAATCSIPGKINSGEPLKQLSSYVGKLTFCQPHIHGMSEDHGVNIYQTLNNGGFGIFPDTSSYLIGGAHDDTHGSMPAPLFSTSVYFNLSLNTKNSINYYGEFLSTIDYKASAGTIYGYDGHKPSNEGATYAEFDKDTGKNVTMREYTCIKSNQLANFNKYLINTMKNVYAYNPDYDSLSVNVGKVSVEDKQVSFNSNIISYNSKLNFSTAKTLNDFVYLGPIRFSDYLSYMSTYSVSFDGVNFKTTKKEGNKTVNKPQVQFEPGYDHCGVSKEHPYLITSLTYNLAVPSKIEAELSYKSSQKVVVKDSTGTNTYINGSVNKKALYGFYNGKLVQLDVKNYTISNSGWLTMIASKIPKSTSDVISTSKTTSWTKKLQHGYAILDTYRNARIRGTSLTINDLVYEPNVEGHRLFVRNNCCNSDGDPRNLVYYRSLTDIESWRTKLAGTTYKNCLYLFTGPCFADTTDLN